MNAPHDDKMHAGVFVCLGVVGYSSTCDFAIKLSLNQCVNRD